MVSDRRIDEKDLQTDIVVIGAGGAGLAAAVAAAEKGANVILLEKRNALGGRSARAEGFFAADSPTQERMGMDAPKDVLFKMAMDYAHWEINPRIIRAFIDKSGDTVRWLEEKGLEIALVSPFYRNQVIRTWHQPKRGGAEVVEVLIKSCRKLGVRLLPQTAAKGILTNAMGEVTAVLAITKEEELKIIAKSVIIATGGYGGNKELLKKYCPFYTEEMGCAESSYMGDGLLMAIGIGAATEGLGALHISGPRFDGAAGHAGIVCQEPQTIWVNKKGERFTDESTAFNHYESVNAILQQPGKVSYSLFDEQIKRIIIERGPIKIRQGVFYGVKKEDMADLAEQLQLQADKGSVKITDSWEEIARWIGADPSVLKSTIDEYNTFCDHGYDAMFVKDRRYLISLRTPPYYAMRCRTGIIGTIGGIKINHHMEVLNRQNNPIHGLYGAGTDVGGWEPHTYNVVLSGSTFGFPLNSGRIAGENAASYVLLRSP
jgi:fumarate reductase flavoprotein subunit